MSAPLLDGPIPDDGIVARLVEIEATCTTGVLRYEGPRGEQGEVVLVRGQIAAEQPRGDREIEELLTLRGGRFELVQELPPLPVSGGDELFREGSLEIHAPADLMRYCEDAGLTGVLLLSHDAASAEARYVSGALEDVQVRGLDTLEEVFGWAQGRFRVEADRKATQPPPATRKDDTGQIFLRTVELTLAAVMQESEARRPPTVQKRTVEPTTSSRHRSVPAPAMPAAPELDPREHTVKVIFLSEAEEPSPVMEVPKIAPASLAPATERDTAPSRKTRPLPVEASAAPSTRRSGGGLGTTLFLSFAVMVFLGVMIALVMLGVD